MHRAGRVWVPDGSDRNIVCTNVPVGTLERFAGNTVDISENSENHLKAIVDGRQVAGKDGFMRCAGKVAERTQGGEKALKIEARSWHLRGASADSIDLREIVLLSFSETIPPLTRATQSRCGSRAQVGQDGLHGLFFGGSKG
jgi:hypothetical protein